LVKILALKKEIADLKMTYALLRKQIDKNNNTSIKKETNLNSKKDFERKKEKFL
jgi:hypothetical protein